MKRWLVILIVLFIVWFAFFRGNTPSRGLVMENVLTDFNKNVENPKIDETAHLSRQATAIGDVIIGKNVFIAPHAFVRGDEGQPLFIGDNSNIQDGAGVHALETEELNASGEWHAIANRQYTAEGELLTGTEENKTGYAVYIGTSVSLAHQSLVHGPAYVGDNTFIGMQSQVFNAKVGKNVAVGVRSLITGGVSIPDNTYIPPGSVITTQEQADALGPRVGSPYENTNKAVVHVNTSLANGYNGNDFDELHIEKQEEKEVVEAVNEEPAQQPEHSEEVVEENK